MTKTLFFSFHILRPVVIYKNTSGLPVCQTSVALAQAKMSLEPCSLYEFRQGKTRPVIHRIHTFLRITAVMKEY